MKEVILVTKEKLQRLVNKYEDRCFARKCNKQFQVNDAIVETLLGGGFYCLKCGEEAYYNFAELDRQTGGMIRTENGAMKYLNKVQKTFEENEDEL